MLHRRARFFDEGLTADFAPPAIRRLAASGGFDHRESLLNGTKLSLKVDLTGGRLTARSILSLPLSLRGWHNAVVAARNVEVKPKTRKSGTSPSRCFAGAVVYEIKSGPAASLRVCPTGRVPGQMLAG